LQVRAQDLDRHLATDDRVARSADHAHAAAIDLAQPVVAFRRSAQLAEWGLFVAISTRRFAALFVLRFRRCWLLISASAATPQASMLVACSRRIAAKSVSRVGFVAVYHPAGVSG